MLTRTKPQEELGMRRYMTPRPPPQEAFRIKEALFYEMLNKTKTLTTTARQKKAKEKVLK